MRLRITAPADHDIDELLVYGNKEHGARSADAYLMGLLEFLDQIPLNPLTAQVREEATPPVRLKVYRAHNVIYDITGDEVIVLRILHHSVNWLDEL